MREEGTTPGLFISGNPLLPVFTCRLMWFALAVLHSSLVLFVVRVCLGVIFEIRPSRKSCGCRVAKAVDGAGLPGAVPDEMIVLARWCTRHCVRPFHLLVRLGRFGLETYARCYEKCGIEKRLDVQVFSCIPDPEPTPV